MLPFLYVHKHTHVCAYICIHKNVSLYLFFPTSSMEYLSLLHAIIQFYFLLNYVPFMQAQFIMWISQTTNAGTTRRKSDLLGRLDSFGMTELYTMVLIHYSKKVIFCWWLCSSHRKLECSCNTEEMLLQFSKRNGENSYFINYISG